jgi:hypothetical protein|nr:MAG TPA: hypothetical protein [Caudoviricetes sp.]
MGAAEKIIEATGNAASKALKGGAANELLPNGAVKGSSIFKTIENFITNPQGSIQQAANPLYTLGLGAAGHQSGMGVGNSLRFAAMNETSRKAFVDKFGERNFVEEFADHEKAGALQKELDSFFDEAKYDHVRTGIAAVTLGSTAYRVASGGGLYRDSDGNFNIIGIPGI